MATPEICWRLHLSSPPERVYAAWIDAGQHPRFWCESSVATAAGFELAFSDGTREVVTVVAADPPWRVRFVYFGAEVDLRFDPAGDGTDLTLHTRGVPDDEWHEVHAGWLSVLLPFKAWVDFRIDLRNHDPMRTWRERFVDQ